MNRTIRAAILIALLLTSILTLSGCMHYTKKVGEYSCVDCHTSQDLLKASLEADPLPVAAESESEGEG